MTYWPDLLTCCITLAKCPTSNTLKSEKKSDEECDLSQDKSGHIRGVVSQQEGVYSLRCLVHSGCQGWRPALWGVLLVRGDHTTGGATTAYGMKCNCSLSRPVASHLGEVGVVFVKMWNVAMDLFRPLYASTDWCSATRGIWGHAYWGNFVSIQGLNRALFLHSRHGFEEKQFSAKSCMDLHSSEGGGIWPPPHRLQACWGAWVDLS